MVSSLQQTMCARLVCGRGYRVEARLKYLLLNSYRPYMDYSSYMETAIFRTAAMLGFRLLQSYMLPCLYALLVMYNTNSKLWIQYVSVIAWVFDFR